MLKVPIGAKDYMNDQRTYVIVARGWPDTFNTIAGYEAYGWEIQYNIGDTLVVYWKLRVSEVVPDPAVA